MAGTVHSITRDIDADRMSAAASALREQDPDGTAADLADLLDAVAAAVKARRDPPMSEAEVWRWSGAVGCARRVSARWSR